MPTYCTMSSVVEVVIFASETGSTGAVVESKMSATGAGRNRGVIRVKLVGSVYKDIDFGVRVGLLVNG